MQVGVAQGSCIVTKSDLRRAEARAELCSAFGWVTLLVPPAPPSVHRSDVRVAHFAEIVRRKRRAKAAAAVEDDLGIRVGDLRLDVALDDALAEVLCARQVPLGPLALFAHV